jgi:hypothetical protein
MQCFAEDERQFLQVGRREKAWMMLPREPGSHSGHGSRLLEMSTLKS